jgi:hypothetical protein
MPTREQLIGAISEQATDRERIQHLEAIARADKTTPHTLTTAAFTQPAVGGTVAVKMATTSWLFASAKQQVTIGKDWGSGFIGGTYEVLTVNNETSEASLRLLSVGVQSAAGVSVPLGSPVLTSGATGAVQSVVQESAQTIIGTELADTQLTTTLGVGFWEVTGLLSYDDEDEAGVELNLSVPAAADGVAVDTLAHASGIYFRAYLRVTAAGTFTVQAAQGSTSENGLAIETSSFLTATRIG